MLNQALSAYESAVRGTLSGRDLEAAVLRKSAQRLKACQDNWATSGEQDLNEALRMNQAIWNLFQAELLESGGQLPPQLRANLLKLSLLVDRESLQILADPDPARLTLLVDINLSIAAGLAGHPALQVIPAPQTTTADVREAACA